MVEISELLRVPAFADLPEDQLAWFLSQSEEVHLKPGDTYVRPSDPAEAMFVVLEGELQVRGEFGGETVIIPVKTGEVTGALPFSRMTRAKVTGRAVTASRILRFPAALFPELVQKMPELTKRLVGVMSDRIREATRIEQQRDRLAALGKLSAGLAHELNNPASAAKRATSQLRDILKRIKDASHELGRRELTPAQKAEIEKLEASLTAQDEPPPDALTISDLEEQIEPWLPGARSERPVATGLRPGAQEYQADGVGIAVCDARSGDGAGRAGEDCGVAGGGDAAERNREQHVAHFRAGAGDQGIHVHGPVAAAERGHREEPGKHAHHPEPQAQAARAWRCSASTSRFRCW